MLTIDLSKAVEDRLAAVAAKRGLSPSECAQEAIRQLLEDQEDIEDAERRIGAPGKRWSLTELEKGLDLDR